MMIQTKEKGSVNKRELDWIKELIERGDEIIKAQREQDEARVKQENIERENAWNDFLIKARRWVPDAIENFLVVNENYRIGFPPKEVGKFNGFETNIPGLAPINVVFEIDEGTPELAIRTIRKTYKVPAVVNDDDEPYAWTFSTKYYSIVGHVYETNVLEVALAKANERYDKLMEYLAKIALHEKEAAEAKVNQQPVYEDVDGSEPLPDLVLINGLRAIVREEIVKLAK